MNSLFKLPLILLSFVTLFNHAAAQIAPSCPGANGTVYTDTQGQAYNIYCQRYSNAAGISTTYPVTNVTFNDCMIACDNTVRCGMVQFTTSPSGSDYGNCGLKRALVNTAGSAILTTSQQVHLAQRVDLSEVGAVVTTTTTTTTPPAASSTPAPQVQTIYYNYYTQVTQTYTTYYPVTATSITTRYNTITSSITVTATSVTTLPDATTTLQLYTVVPTTVVTTRIDTSIITRTTTLSLTTVIPTTVLTTVYSTLSLQTTIVGTLTTTYIPVITVTPTTLFQPVVTVTPPGPSY